ncbi:hypothetical protein LINPERPRIM_LOCUS24973 [Linum perenne]
MLTSIMKANQADEGDSSFMNKTEKVVANHHMVPWAGLLTPFRLHERIGKDEC